MNNNINGDVGSSQNPAIIVNDNQLGPQVLHYENVNAYFASFPAGFRFKPKDDELIVSYLKRKAANKVLPPNKIHEVDIYKKNPETLSALYEPMEGKEWYFFTPRDRKYKNGCRPNRGADDGYWKATGADKKVKHGGVLVGYKKSLVFYRGKPPFGEKTNWIMHEYRSEIPPEKRKEGSEDMKLDGCILCKIYKKASKSMKHSRGGQEDESQSESPEHRNPSQQNAEIRENFVDNMTRNHNNLSQMRYLSTSGGFSHHQKPQNRIAVASNVSQMGYVNTSAGFSHHQNPQNRIPMASMARNCNEGSLRGRSSGSFGFPHIPMPLTRLEGPSMTRNLNNASLASSNHQNFQNGIPSGEPSYLMNHARPARFDYPPLEETFMARNFNYAGPANFFDYPSRMGSASTSASSDYHQNSQNGIPSPPLEVASMPTRNLNDASQMGGVSSYDFDFQNSDNKLSSFPECFGAPLLESSMYVQGTLAGNYDQNAPFPGITAGNNYDQNTDNKLPSANDSSTMDELRELSSYESFETSFDYSLKLPHSDVSPLSPSAYQNNVILKEEAKDLDNSNDDPSSSSKDFKAE